MTSNGGGRISIYGRDNLPKDIEHFGGKNGIFTPGLYCSHPKKTLLLLPLKNFSDTIESLLLEEILRAYKALGAKTILIEDVSEIKVTTSVRKKMFRAGAKVQFKKTILRSKTFGKGIFNAERTLKDSLFIYDYPNIMTIIHSRIDGNQLTEKFTENIDLSLGLDLQVLNVFNANANYNYERTWHFTVEFWDKNDIS